MVWVTNQKENFFISFLKLLKMCSFLRKENIFIDFKNYTFQLFYYLIDYFIISTISYFDYFII